MFPSLHKIDWGIICFFYPVDCSFGYNWNNNNEGYAKRFPDVLNALFFCCDSFYLGLDFSLLAGSWALVFLFSVLECLVEVFSCGYSTN
ncbi:MAG: hypothetical protein EBQ87_07630 [Planctomycetes bacterium]|nr:hypothetical protein [Planctomycetota bacterium]